MTRPQPSRRAVTVGGLGLLGLAACSSGTGDAGGPAPSATRLGGAEPSDAPEPAEAPAGEVAPAGYAAEGVVVDPVSGLVVVGVRRPDRLLVLAPDTLAVQRTVRVPGSVRHLAVVPAGGTVLVPNEGDDSLLEADVLTGATRSTPVGHVPHDGAGTVGGELVVADEFGGSLSIVRDGAVVFTVDDLTQPGGVVALGSNAVAVDVADFSVSTYDLSARRRTGRLPAGAGPTHVTVAGEDRVAVADTRGGRLLLFSVDPLRQVATLEVGTSPYGLAGDPDAGLVWVTLTASNELVGVDTAGDRLRVIERYPTVRQPNSVAATAGSGLLFVASRTDGTVQRIAR